MIYIHLKILILQIEGTQALKLKMIVLQVTYHNSFSSIKSLSVSSSESDSLLNSEDTKYEEENKDNIDTSFSHKRNKIEDDAKSTAFSTPFGTKVTSFQFSVFILCHLVRIWFRSKNYGFI